MEKKLLGFDGFYFLSSAFSSSSPPLPPPPTSTITLFYFRADDLMSNRKFLKASAGTRSIFKLSFQYEIFSLSDK